METRSAETLLCSYLARREAGETVDLEALCAGHPSEAAEIRSLLAGHETLVGDFRQLGDGAAQQRLTARVEGLRASRPRWQRYLRGERIGGGGMGDVIEAFDRDLDRGLAMKVLRGGASASSTDSVASSDPRGLARFLREAHVAGRLDHPGMVPVYDVGIDDQDRAFYTMKRVRGRDLESILSGGDPEWTRVRLLDVLLRACEAVAFAHSRGVVHRDIKPANIMVGDFGETYMMDWGLARLDQGVEADPESVPGTPGDHDATLTLVGDVMGTPSYMPPEQARGETVSAAADVYSMGAVLYRVLTGRAPFVETGGDNGAAAVHGRVLAGPPRPVAELAADAPVELVSICAKAMARRPEERYADMQAMARDLRAHLEGRVVAAHATGWWIELRKWIGRNRTVAAAAAAAAVIALGSVSAVALIESDGRRRQTELVGRLATANASLEQAKGLAETRADEASRERADAEFVAEFLAEIFDAPTPQVARGRELAARDVLDAASERVVRATEGSPRLRGRLQHEIGSAYLSIGDLDSARQTLNAALALRRQQGDRVAVLETRAELAGLQLEAGEIDAAQDEFRRIADAYASELPPNDRRWLAARNGLAVCCAKLGQQDEAEAIYRELLDAPRDAAAPASRAMWLHNLGMSRLSRGRADEAEPLLREASAVLAAIGEADAPDGIQVRVNLGIALRRIDRKADAEEVLVGAEATARRVLGDEHTTTLFAQVALARTLRDRGSLDRCEALLRQALAVRSELYADNIEDLVPCLQELGSVYRLQGRLDKARPLLERAVETLRQHLGRDHMATLEAVMSLAVLLLASRENDAAEKLLADALASFEEHYPDHTRRDDFAGQLARIALQKGDQPRAEKLVAEIAARRRDRYGDDHRDTLVARHNLAFVYRAQRRLDESLALASDGLARRRRLLGDGDRHTLSSLELIAQVLRDLGRTTEALAHAQELVERTPAADPKRGARERLLSEIRQGGR